MKKRMTLLLVFAAMLLTFTMQAQNVRQVSKKPVLSVAQALGKSVQMKGVKKKLTAQELQAAKSKGAKQALVDKKGRKPLVKNAPRRAALTPTPVNTPFEADFLTTETVMDDFIIINNNEDLSDNEPCTWKWSIGNGAYYVYNEDGETAADDYLVLPIMLEGGKVYDVTVNAATWNYPEEFEVVAGTECAAEALTTVIIDKTMPENDPADYTGTFTPTADGVYYVAIHVTSEADMYMLSVYRFSIDVAPSPDAPAAVSGLTVTQVPAELQTIVKFNAPTTTIGGDDLTGDISVEVLRNGESLITLTGVAPGSEQIYVSDVPEEGVYVYQLIPYNAAGKGRKSHAQSVRVIMPQDIPYFVSFADDEDALDNFLVIDNNNDGSTWTPNYDMNAGMIVAYRYDWDNDADDYLVSQPLRLQAGKNYEVTVRAAASNEETPERFEVVAGTSATTDDLIIPIIAPTDVASSDFVDFSGSFTAEKDGIYYVAIHAISDADCFYLNVSHLSVELGAEPTAPAAPTLTAEAGAEGALTATIQVTAPTQCVNGDALTAITKIELYRDNNLIDQQNQVTPGAVLTFIDDDVEALGLHHYYAVAYNESGNGEKSEKLAVYIGLDQPGAPLFFDAVDRGTAIDFSWEAVTKGMHDGYVNPDNITYDVWTLYVSSFYVFFEDKLASVTGQTAVTADYNTDEGDEQDYTYFAIRTTNEATDNEDNAAWNFTSLLTGKPYDTPLHEGFSEGELHYFWESNGMVMITNYAADNDRAALALLTETPGNILFVSGKLNLNDTNNPLLLFSALSPNISQLHVLGDVDGNNDWKLLQTFDLQEEDYQHYQVSLASLKNHQRYARIAFLADYKNVAVTDDDGYLEEYGDYIFLDDVRIGDFFDHDLSAYIFALETVVAGNQVPIGVFVENVGLQEASNFTLTIKAGEEVLLQETAAQTLSSFDYWTKAIMMPTTVFDEAGDVTITATIDYAADQNRANNVSENVFTIVEPDAVAPESLVAEQTAAGVELTWTAPATEAKEYTEDFESGSGLFTQIDANGDGYEWVFMVGEDLNSHSGTCAMQSYSWVPDEVGAVTPDNWLVTPMAILDGTFSFWASAQDGDWTDEHFAVYVSTKGNTSVDDFEMVSEEFVATGYPMEYTVDLSSYAGQTGYIAIRHYNCYDNFALVVDDITFIKAPDVPVRYNIYVDRELVATVDSDVTTYTVDMPSEPGEHSFAVSAVYQKDKQSRPATATITVTTDIRQIATDGQPVDIYSVDGRLLRRQATSLEGLKGVYIVRQAAGSGKAVMVR